MDDTSGNLLKHCRNNNNEEGENWCVSFGNYSDLIIYEAMGMQSIVLVLVISSPAKLRRWDHEEIGNGRWKSNRILRQ